MDNNKDESIKILMKEMFNIQTKSNNFMKLLIHDEDISENLVLLLLRIKLMGFLKITDISDAFLLTPGAASNMCDKLEKMNYIERVRIKDDRRVVRVRLTTKGEERVEDVFSKFSIETLDTITSYLSEINNLFKNIENKL